MKKMTLFRLIKFFFPRELKVINVILGVTTLPKLTEFFFAYELLLVNIIIHVCFAFLHYVFSIVLNYTFDLQRLCGAIVWMVVGYSLWKNYMLVLYEVFSYLHG